MPQRNTSVHHQWMGATAVPLTASQARMIAEANRRWITFPGDVRVRIVDAYCSMCGGTWPNVHTEQCVRPAEDDPTYAHQWIGAALVPLDDEQAVIAVEQQRVSFPRRLDIDITETYCNACHRGWQVVADRPCEAAESNEHLRGGPIGERAPRRQTVQASTPKTVTPKTTILITQGSGKTAIMAQRAAAAM